MPRAAHDPPRKSTRPRPIPLEDDAAGSWPSRVRQTLIAMLLHPARSFAVCPEPIDHGRVLRFLATLRIPAWLLLLMVLAANQMSLPEGTGVPSRAVHIFVEPSLARVISAWLLLMIPVGLPLLYFVSGLVAHIGVALLGGASRSIGASMRATGYVLGLMFVVVGVVDIPLYLGYLPGQIFVPLLGGMGLLLWVLSAVALARTHQIAVARGAMAALLPTIVFVAATLGRAALELSELPGLPPPGSPYALP